MKNEPKISSASTEWARLRHDFAHAINRFDVKVIVSLYESSSPGNEDGKRIIQEWLASLDELKVLLRKLLHKIIDGFSPIQLVNSGPLAQGLPENALDIIRNTLHQTYLVRTKIEKLKEEIEQRTDEFELKLQRFDVLWRQQPSSASAIIEGSLKELLESGDALHEALCRLPKEIVLP